MQKLTMSHLADQLAAGDDLKPLHADLVARGIITEAELEIARALQQTFYNPRRKRFAMIHEEGNKAAVVYLEPPRHERERLTPCLPHRQGKITKRAKAEQDEFWAAYKPPSPKRFGN